MVKSYLTSVLWSVGRTIEGTETCIVCYERPPSVLFACGHMCCCLQCADGLRTGQSPLCPLCRAKISP